MRLSMQGHTCKEAFEQIKKAPWLPLTNLCHDVVSHGICIEFQSQWKQQLGRADLEDSVLEAFQTPVRVAKVSQVL